MLKSFNKFGAKVTNKKQAIGCYFLLLNNVTAQKS